MKLSHLFAGLAVAALLVVSPFSAAAQSPLAAADAAPFLGTWTLSLQGPQGAFEQNLAISDKGGKVAATLTNQMTPDPTEIYDITKSGSDLVLKFDGDFQGQAFKAKITLTPDGDNKAHASFDVMDGQFVMDGTAVKK